MIVCLLPARNAEADLEEWLRCVPRFADWVVALDDGSTDRTREILAADPFVTSLLCDPPHEGYQDWDDHRNRQRLLDAAAELEPDWIVFLDADERIDADDAIALRAFLERDAIRGCAYGLCLFRDWDDGVELEPSVVYRCFAAGNAMRLPEERLHFTPVPTSIPSGAWIPTTIRARHLHSAERDEARRQRYAEADPTAEWERGQPVGDKDALVAWAPRPVDLPVLGTDGVRPQALFERSQGSPSLCCLLPVRNGERDLPGYLSSVAGFADAVIALDDGSIDSTAEILAASPLVVATLNNPPRDTYHGWDDLANRQRLLEEGRRRGFDWLFFLDADERIDEADHDALRDLVDRVGDPECAYGFRVFRMIGEDTYDRARLWVYRLFSGKAEGDLPKMRLHFVPVPAALDRSEWLQTTIRIRHLASVDEQRRAERVRKYGEADPDLTWQSSYENLAEPPGTPRPWRQRPPGFPVLAASGLGSRGAPLDLATLDPEGPLLSAIVIARNDVDRIERAVKAVVEQRCGAEFEVIVAASGDDGTAELVRRRFPEVIVVDVPEPGLPGMARNAGLAVARGEYISFPGSHVELPPGSLEARIQAHELGWPMVTGTLLNGNLSRPGWASYFLDASGALPGRPSGVLGGAPARCSYTRDALDGIGGFPADVRAGEDTVVNQELWRLGYRAYRAQDLRLIHRSPCDTPRRLVAHHFTRGRALGRILGRDGVDRGLIGFALHYPGQRLRDLEERVSEWGNGVQVEYQRAKWLIVLGTLAAWCGLFVELIGARKRRRVT